MDSNKEIYGLGLKPKKKFSDRLKKCLVSFFKKIEKKAPFPFNRALQLLYQRIHFKSFRYLRSHELKTIVSFIEKNLPPDRYFVMYSEKGKGNRIAKQLKSSKIGGQLWAHYDSSHKAFNSFSRNTYWVGVDQSYKAVDFILFLTSSFQYETKVRLWKFEFNSPWKIILPFYTSKALSLKEWENPTPTLLWCMQYAGAGRLNPIFLHLTRVYQRTSVKYTDIHSFTSRSIANLKQASAFPYQCEVGHFMGQEKHLYENPKKDELTQLLCLVSKRLPYGSWTYVHEFIDFSKLAHIKDLQSVILMRDPRDMMISAFFRGIYDPRHLPDDHPYAYLKNHISEISSVDMESFKEQSLLCLAKGGTFKMCPTYYMLWPSIKELAQSFLAAKRNPNAFCVKLEDIHSQPKRLFYDLLSWLSWNPRRVLSKKELQKAIGYGTFAYQTKGKITEGQGANFTRFDSKTGQALSARKGTKGDWKNHFSKKVKEYVKEQIGQELVELGYEKGLNW